MATAPVLPLPVEPLPSPSDRAQADKPLTLRSRLSGPIGCLTHLQQTLLFAELSLLSYFDIACVRRVATRVGLPNVQSFDRDGAQAYVLANERDCVVACRGTEPTDWNDIKADVNAATVVAETVGRVHRGFKHEVDRLWPDLEQVLAGRAASTWFTGHSLGAAMATICASRCVLSHTATTPTALFTFGSPRVGNRRYLRHVSLRHVRCVNNNDLVARMPPVWLGYAHCGHEMYLDHDGLVRRLSDWARFVDRVCGLFRALQHFQVDYFLDHPIQRYIDALTALVADEQAKSTPPAQPLIRPRRRLPHLRAA